MRFNTYFSYKYSTFVVSCLLLYLQNVIFQQATDLQVLKNWNLLYWIFFGAGLVFFLCSLACTPHLWDKFANYCNVSMQRKWGTNIKFSVSKMNQTYSDFPSLATNHEKIPVTFYRIKNRWKPNGKYFQIGFHRSIFEVNHISYSKKYI